MDSTSVAAQPKSPRRILCVRPRFNQVASEMLRATSDEWVEALKVHCEVHSVEEDFDLAAVCDRLKPDMIVHDAFHWGRPFALKIANPRAHPEIPRVLYLDSDPHDPMRPLTARVMDELGIDTVFVTAEAYRLQMPELRHKHCYFAHQFFDDTVFRDYGLPKTIPVSIFGGKFMPGFYAWRARTLTAIQEHLPTLIYTHPGYQAKDSIDPFAVQGEAYARILNQCWFSAADTTRADYLVRKHLEIPASGTVLIAPDSRALHHYGFVDRENCLLGDGPDLFAKIAEVAGDPATYERIRQAGMTLVHSRYTRRTWTHFLDWLECRKALRPGQMIQQDGLYGPFRIVAADSPALSVAKDADPDNELTRAFAEARSAILTGSNLAGAEARMCEAISWLGHVAEPLLMAGITLLLRGDAVQAALTIGRRAELQGAIDAALGVFDPVEAAWIMLIARLIGNEGLERAMRDQTADLHHLCLRRTAWLLSGMSADPAEQDLLERSPDDTLSIHWLGDDDFAVWCNLVTRVLWANRAGSTFAVNFCVSLSRAA